ncbi:hypothetical protein B0T26DRAFT_111007 [Lasiosphaeria miniovina]|uniref:Uncharacterized protein n=1 Tax=Lasiosphaeria miniovina TaxID=1954250 RepID=A0AA40B3R6_9PEZI|nr:uncharacterized protein B0T26DRAFT_111007 [Lasiosphaeria miniovina]KAK0726983.1 hypothetical protein B0T26DRAFT_111007 [Lasiosphaeria miniovina]
MCVHLGRLQGVGLACLLTTEGTGVIRAIASLACWRWKEEGTGCEGGVQNYPAKNVGAAPFPERAAPCSLLH